MTSPIQVKCSKSLYQIVRVTNNQDIHIIVTDDSQIYTYSSYLNVKHVRKFTDGSRIYEICQISSNNLNENSTFFLGAISVGNKTLLIYLESLDITKSNNITIFSPSYETVLLKPYQTLEVVIPDVVFPITSWEWEWWYYQDIEIENVFNRCIRMNHYPWSNKPNKELENFPVSRIIPVNQENLQRHFWFKFDKSILSNLSENQSLTKDQPVGRLCFSKIFEKNNPEYVVDICVDLRKKFLTRTTESFSNTPQKSVNFATKTVYVSEINFELLTSNSIEQGCNVFEWDEQYISPSIKVI